MEPLRTTSVVIPGFSSYVIDEYGNVKSYRRKQNIPLKCGIDDTGYRRVKLIDDRGNVSSVRIHQLVARTFVPNPEDKKTVNHKDGDKLNNHFSNLEWCDQVDNVHHAYDFELRKNNVTFNVKVHSVLTGDTLHFRFLSDVCKEFDITQNKLMALARNFPHLILKRGDDGFIFEASIVEKGETFKPSYEVRIFDAVTKEETIVNSLRKASIKTGLGESTVRGLMASGKMSKGFMFKKGGDRSDFPFICPKEAARARKEFKAGRDASPKKVTVTILDSGEKLTFPSLRQMAIHFQMRDDVPKSRLCGKTSGSFIIPNIGEAKIARA